MTGKRSVGQHLENRRRLLEWRNTICSYLTSNNTLSSSQLAELSKFLGQIAVWVQRLVEANIELCVFCRNNNEPYEIYTSHKVKDRFGRVTCPTLRRFTCPVCKATGDRAHTIRYCPRLPPHGTGPTMQFIGAGLIEPTYFS